MSDYVVIVPHIVGSPHAWETVYSSDEERFSTRQRAIDHGYRTTGTDDFLLAVLEGGEIMTLAWEHDDRDDPEERAEVAAAFGWSVAS